MPSPTTNWTHAPAFHAEAQRLDAADPLAGFRERFHMPRHAGRDALYFTGNSLGLQPVAAAEYIEGELEDLKKISSEITSHLSLIQKQQEEDKLAAE